MMNKTMLMAMCEQSKLDHGIDTIKIEKGGKVIIIFKNLELVQRCISHFHGRVWGASVVSAMHVCTVDDKTKKSSKKDSLQVAAPLVPGPVFVPSKVADSVDAPMFVPVPEFMKGKRASAQSGQLSADAPVFVPSTHKQRGSRQRSNSDMSTEAEGYSEGSSCPASDR
jgi:hypothetical protein